MSTPSSATLQNNAALPDVMHDPKNDQRVRFLPIDEIGLAIRKNWLLYLAFALVPPATMILCIFFLIWNGAAMEQSFGGVGWLVVGMTWISIAVPLAFFIRRKLWIDWYRGDGVVSPENYFKGNLIVWTPMVIGGMMGFIGTAMTAGPASLFTSITALVLFLSQNPDASALTKPVGDHDDPAVYQEPK